MRGGREDMRLLLPDGTNKPIISMIGIDSFPKGYEYDRERWTPMIIAETMSNFFKKLLVEDEWARTERQRLLEKATIEEEAREAAEREIMER